MAVVRCVGCRACPDSCVETSEHVARQRGAQGRGVAAQLPIRIRTGRTRLSAPGPIEPVLPPGWSRTPAPRPAGALLGTIAALAAVGGAATAAYASYTLFARDLAARDVVHKMRRLREAGENWVRVNYTAVLQQAAAGPIEIPLADLVSVGLLPAGFEPVDTFGQRYAVLVRRTPTSPAAAASPAAIALLQGQLEILVAGTGGRPMPAGQARYIASVVEGGAAVAQEDPAMLQGAYGVWRTAAADWATAALPAPQPGSVAALLVLHPGEMQVDYLHRYRLPGQDGGRFNQMSAPLRFAAGGIRDVRRLTVDGLRILPPPGSLPPHIAAAAPYAMCPVAPVGSALPFGQAVPGVTIRAGGSLIGVPMTCTSLLAAAPNLPQWVPWHVIGVAGGLPVRCGPEQVLQWTGSNWSCGYRGPPCVVLGHPSQSCPVYCPSQGSYVPAGAVCPPPSPPPCSDTPWQCYPDGYWYWSCTNGWIHGDDANCAPSPTPCPGYAPVPYGSSCPVLPQPCPSQLYGWGTCPSGIPEGLWRDGVPGQMQPNCSYPPAPTPDGWYHTTCLPPPPTGPRSCPGECWPTTGYAECGIPGPRTCVGGPACSAYGQPDCDGPCLPNYTLPC
jgi:Bacterial shufflon protein, N-terminal constant region